MIKLLLICLLFTACNPLGINTTDISYIDTSINPLCLQRGHCFQWSKEVRPFDRVIKLGATQEGIDSQTILIDTPESSYIATEYIRIQYCHRCLHFIADTSIRHITTVWRQPIIHLTTFKR